MAELHLLGQLQGTTNFLGNFSLFCRYSFQTGPNWTLVSGCPEGQTVSGKSDHYQKVVWAQPIDIHYVTKGIQGWPKIILQVNCLDNIGRSWVVGYGCTLLPSTPGHHTISVPCWSPAPSTFTDKIRQYFLGGSSQLLETDIINLGSDRFKLKTESKGHVTIKIDIILRNFSSFGVEYK